MTSPGTPNLLIREAMTATTMNHTDMSHTPSSAVNFSAVTLLSVGVIIGAVVGVGIGASLIQLSAQSAAVAAPTPIANKIDAYRGRDTRLKTPRILPVDPKDYTPAQRAIAREMHNANHRTVLHNPALAEHWTTWLAFVHDNPGTRAKTGDGLPLIDKELVVLRTN